MAKNDKPIIVRDFSRANIRTVQDSIAPRNSVKLALNLSTEKEIGSLVSRLGTDIVGSQSVASSTCRGLHYHRDTVATNHKLFGVFSDGTNNDIYDMLTGSKSLEDDTKNLKTRFCTFLNSTVRVNGIDPVKSYNGSSWVSTGGAFDESNMPLGKTVVEWKDQVYTWGVAASKNILYYSSVADPDARTVSWATVDGAGQIEIEQEDGGGDGTALEKVPGYLIILKERSMKRWDGASTYPEDLINVGAPSQEAVCRGRGMIFIGNQEGLWVTNGGYPQCLSKPIQDLWDAITDHTLITTYCDERFVKIYVGDITLNGNTYSKICFVYNIDDKTWDIFSYYNEFTIFTWYIDSGKKVIVAGDKDGHSLKMDSGFTDYEETTPIPITYSLETQDIDFGRRGRIKEITLMNVYTKNTKLCQLMYRANSHKDEDWKIIHNVTNDVETITDFKAKGNWFNFKITGITDSGQVKIFGYEFEEGAVSTAMNAKE